MKKSAILFFVTIASAVITTFIFSCNAVETEQSSEEIAQQIGDVMASIDEFGGSGGTLTMLQKTFDRRAQEEKKGGGFAKIFLTEANAATCLGNGFSSCFSGLMTRNFGDCTILGATFSGTVKLTWNNALTCSMNNTFEYVTREPNFSVTGRLGATMVVKKINTYGQKLTWASGAGVNKVFIFDSDGINRTYTSSDGTILFDQTTYTASPITISGTSRSNRIMTGGSLRVYNNLSQTSCDYTPKDVAWSADCNCPTSGTWAGTCSNSNTSTLVITGCGKAQFTAGSFNENITFDRCGT